VQQIKNSSQSATLPRQLFVTVSAVRIERFTAQYLEYREHNGRIQGQPPPPHSGRFNIIPQDSITSALPQLTASTQKNYEL